MKKFLFFITILGMSSVVSAADTTTGTITTTPTVETGGVQPASLSAPNVGVNMNGKKTPCLNIISACRAAGFEKRSMAPGKGLMKDCLVPLINGQNVAGVTVSADDITGCKAKTAKIKRLKGNENINY